MTWRLHDFLAQIIENSHVQNSIEISLQNYTTGLPTLCRSYTATELLDISILHKLATDITFLINPDRKKASPVVAMTSIPSNIRLCLSTLLISSLLSKSSAQLSGCTAAICPGGESGRPSCELGNLTSAAIGIASFNTSLSMEPLSWTISVQDVRNQTRTFERDFLLGTPSSVNLQQSLFGAQACSLFFDGVLASLRFPGSDMEYDKGTCADALTAQCAIDLQNQAQAELATLLLKENNTNQSNLCLNLGSSLRDKPPSACSSVIGESWNTIIARPLTGNDVSKPIELGDCHPTAGKDYGLTLVATHRVTAPSRNTSDIEAVLNGITPIMTVFYGDKKGHSQINLSCLKTVGTEQGSTTIKKEGAASCVRGAGSSVLFCSVILSTALFLFWGGLTL